MAHTRGCVLECTIFGLFILWLCISMNLNLRAAFLLSPFILGSIHNHRQTQSFHASTFRQTNHLLLPLFPIISAGSTSLAVAPKHTDILGFTVPTTPVAPPAIYHFMRISHLAFEDPSDSFFHGQGKEAIRPLSTTHTAYQASSSLRTFTDLYQGFLGNLECP